VLRLEMRARFNASAMGQPEPFANSLEATLRAMWLRWCAGLPPTPMNE
jgi:protein O-GlcNAc transferase